MTVRRRSAAVRRVIAGFRSGTGGRGSMLSFPTPRPRA
ncbi:Uncharacterised protein [Amycolatopsis camponoti]|uniref:Uncharacterized protein n=1 Tax=Amycolatopsis camponoti TaxID=2606593 RepID=A0A6I8LZM7_9PSEU|nr:Uncharacterised protein [Amycolatopsis camponoti]